MKPQMHEFSVMSQIIDVVLKEAESRGAEKIQEVNLEIGEFTFLGEEQLRFAFDVLTRGTIADGAELKMVTQAGTIECECGYSGLPERPEETHVLVPILRCPVCKKIAHVKEGLGCTVRDISLVIPDVEA